MSYDSVPLVSVVITVYNGEKYLGDAIRSILSQDYANFELVICDDCSTDLSSKIIKDYERKDARIHYLKTDTNVGPFVAANQAIIKCNGKYIARLDADDIALPKRLSSQVDYLERNPSYKLIGSSYETIDEDGTVGVRVDNPHTHNEALIFSLFGNPIGHSTVMFSKEFAQRFGFYNEERRKSQDYKLYLDVTRQGGKIGNLNKVLSQYRTHSENITNSFKGPQYKNEQVQFGLDINTEFHKDLLGYNPDRNQLEIVKRGFLGETNGLTKLDKLTALVYLRKLKKKSQKSSRQIWQDSSSQSILEKYVDLTIELLLSDKWTKGFARLLIYKT